MPKTVHVALLRGINVGRAKRVAMADLRSLIEDLGYGNARTLLNSGNVVLTAENAESNNMAMRIEKAISERLGVSAKVITLTAKELAAIVAKNPLTEAAENPSRFLVAVLRNRNGRLLLKPLLEQDWSPESIALGTRAAYIWCPEGILASRLPEAVGRLLGDAVTTRNWGTIMKLHALAQKP